jgi:hypothetical protein
MRVKTLLTVPVLVASVFIMRSSAQTPQQRKARRRRDHREIQVRRERQGKGDAHQQGRGSLKKEIARTASSSWR